MLAQTNRLVEQNRESPEVDLYTYGNFDGLHTYKGGKNGLVNKLYMDNWLYTVYEKN